MEKRWSERKALRVGVDVYRQGELLGCCVSRDIGLGGTYLNMDEDSGFNLRNSSDVELVFSLKKADRGSQHRINARVTRVDADGAGLKFRNFDTGVFRSLQEILSYQRAPENRPSASALINELMK